MVKHGQRYDALLNPSTESQQSCYENDIKRRREKNISHKVKYFVYVYRAMYFVLGKTAGSYWFLGGKVGYRGILFCEKLQGKLS